MSSTSLERITQEEMLAEFGARGVENPTIVDLIALDTTSDQVVVLAMFERRPWGPDRDHARAQLGQIEEKLNRYLGYVLDGFFIQQFPRYAGKRVRLRLDCAEAPHGTAIAFLDAARRAVEHHGLELEVNVVAASD
jgi:hypothetical protein